MESYTEKKKILRSSQSSFRIDHSYELVLCIITNVLLSDINNGKAARVFCIGETKSIGPGNHNILL